MSARAPLFAMAALAVVAIAVAGGARLGGVKPVQVRPAAVAGAIDLRFQDLDDGAVRVLNARDDSVIETLAPQSNAFLRTVMRGFTQARRRAGLGDETPFRVERSVDAHLSLSDPATGRRVELNPFGDINANAFGRFVPATPRRT